MPCNIRGFSQHFGVIYCIHLQGRSVKTGEEEVKNEKWNEWPRGRRNGLSESRDVEIPEQASRMQGTGVTLKRVSTMVG